MSRIHLADRSRNQRIVSSGVRKRVLSYVLILAMLVSLAACGIAAGSAPDLVPRGDSLDAGPHCGAKGPVPETYDHVIWIFEENHNLQYDSRDPEAGVIGNPNAPYINQLAKECAYSTEFIDTHPGMHSEPHYLDAVSGSNCNAGFGTVGQGCIVDNRSPAHHMLTTNSIFSQLEASGKTWTSYQESAPSNCYRAYYIESGIETYAPKHDPALFFTNLNQSCATNDIAVPTWAAGKPAGRLADDITQDRLPNFSFITPNEQHDMHISTGGNVREGDAWLAAYLRIVFNSTSYKEGRTAIFVLWDETYKGGTTRTPNLIIAPTAHAGPVGTTMNNIAVLRATQLMLGLVPGHPFLGCASGKTLGGVGQCPIGSTADVRHVANV